MKHVLKLAIMIAAAVIFAVSACAVSYAEPTKSELVYLEAYGAAFAMAAYNTQIVTGMTGDSFVGNVYTADEAKDVLSEQKSMIQVQIDYIAKVDATASGEKVLKDMKDVCDLLIIMINSLESYINDPSIDNANLFETKRKESYKAITDLLGISEE